MAELVIKISGDLKDYKTALEMATEETEALSSQLATIAKVSGVAFAALTAEIFVSVQALNVEAKALQEVTDALQNQGIYTDELAASYRKTAEAIEEKTGVDGDAISSAQATAQSLIGQTALTDDLTRAVVDFAVKQKTDVTSAYTLVAKAVNGNVAGLQKMGITIEEGLTKQERLARITEVLQQKFNGSAESAANATGSTEKLSSAFGNLQKEIGRRFAPAFDVVVGALTDFINLLKDNKPLTDFIVSMIAAGLAVSGAALVVGVAGIAFLKLKAALLAAQIATGAMTIATRALVGATGLGLLVIILAEIYLNWESIWPRMQKIYSAFAQNITDVALGLGKILFAVLIPTTDSLSKIQEGAKQVAEAVKKGYATATEEVAVAIKPAGVQDPGKADAAKKEAEIARQNAAEAAAVRKAEKELAVLQEQEASLEMIELKKQEVELLKQLEDDKNNFMKDSLTRRLEETRVREAEQIEIDKERRAVLNDELLAENEAFQALTDEQKQQFLARNQQQLEQGILTEKTARDAAVKEELAQQKAAHNTFLLEQQKYGTAYAAINKAMHSAIFQGSKTAFGELAQLQESSNSTLKGIGKVSAIASIVIKTAESAMNIYAGFSTIPIIGPVLGVAGAAAAIAFGAEQVGKVRGAAQGGIATGGIRGRDSIPFMLSPGELVAPERSFDEVIGSVRAAREAKNITGGALGAAGGDNQALAILASIDAKLSQPSQNTIVIEGDALTDEAWIDRIGRGISDALEFRNLKIFGVNA